MMLCGLSDTPARVCSWLATPLPQWAKDQAEALSTMLTKSPMLSLLARSLLFRSRDQSLSPFYPLDLLTSRKGLGNNWSVCGQGRTRPY